jgi:DNA-directed RNA polymerase subunit RPC12/RpoP
MEEERIIHRGKKIWYLVPPEGIQQETWRPGHLYLTDKRLFWWYDFDKKIVFDISVDRVISISTEVRKTSGLDTNKEKVLNVVYSVNSSKRIASFSGKQIDEWEKVLGQLLSEKEEIETCPECGKETPVKELLENGCPYCNWVSSRLRKKAQEIATGV